MAASLRWHYPDQVQGYFSPECKALRTLAFVCNKIIATAHYSRHYWQSPKVARLGLKKIEQPRLAGAKRVRAEAEEEKIKCGRLPAVGLELDHFHHILLDRRGKIVCQSWNCIFMRH